MKKNNKVAKYAKIFTVEITRLFQFLLATMALEFVGSMFGPIVAVIFVSSIVIMFTFYYRLKFVRTMYITWIDDTKIIRGYVK